MFCGECGAQNRDDGKFCTSCGSALGSACPSCGAPVEPGTRFCGECGTSLQETGTPAPLVTAAPSSERRLVSVVFADLVGFTSYSEGRDPEDVRNMLGSYFDRARRIAELYGGVVEKFIGDAVMAVWGTPVAREDDAERSVRAALELLEAVTALGREIGLDLHARAGVFTGEAAVTLGAEGQGMVAGDMVNTAARLQSVAVAGTVLVDRATYQSTRSAIAYEEAGVLQLKGRDEPVEAWRALRVTAGVGGFRSDDALEPPFTGRHEELRLIKELLHATEREGKPRLASVVGVAGIGKSRLAWEFYKYVDGLSDRIWWHQGRSPAYGDGVAFWALAEMVRRRARIAETDDSEDARKKLDACLVEYIADEDERRWLRTPLAHLLGLEDGSREQREQLFAAWRTFFERIAQVGPLVMVFEDLHWSDPGLIDFIEHMMAWARSSPILVVTLARPDLMDKRPNWGAGQRNFVSIHLEPLSEEDMMILLKGIVDDLPEGVRNEIVQRAEGIPLYAVEMVRMLLDRYSLVAQAGGFRWTGEVEHIEVPETLHSLIASRLDSLPLKDRLLVQDAAVLGKTFTLDSLSSVTGLDPTELEVRLKDLARREIFVIDMDPRSPERGQYGFVQSLMREIAYQILSNVDRRDRHLSAAAHFVDLDEPEMVDVVATHYLEAYKNSKDDKASEIAEKARAALIEAAGRARSLGSGEQASTLYQKALSITSGGPERGELLFHVGDSALWAGQVDIGTEHLLEAIDALRTGRNSDLLARARVRLGVAYFLASRLPDAIEMLEAAAAEIEEPESDPNAGSIFGELARIHMFAGNLEEAETYSRKALPPAERHGRLVDIAEVIITRGVIALMQGRTNEADALLSGGMKLATENGLVPQQVRALINISANTISIDPAMTIDAASQGLEIARRYGLKEQIPFLLTNALEG
ncbi:MAG: adenylate/guanylate cyclase domain-containing protein, partial [Actinomycetota bacterium]